MISVEGISKAFGSVQVLRNVSFSLSPGEAIAVIGPNGSGKSVLLRATALVDPPDTGQIRVDGRLFAFPGEPSRERRASLWPNVTVVFQQLFLWPHLRLRENIALPGRRIPDGDKPYYEEIVRLFELDSILDRFPNQVSLGERQRACRRRGRHRGGG